MYTLSGLALAVEFCSPLNLDDQLMNFKVYYEAPYLGLVTYFCQILRSLIRLQSRISHPGFQDLGSNFLTKLTAAEMSDLLHVWLV